MRLFVFTFFTSLFLGLSAGAETKPAMDPDEGVKHIDWKDAASAIGQTVFVSGRVVNVGGTNTISFLNFDNKRPPDFVAVVFAESRRRFPKDLKTLYENKLVEIRGLVVTYQDRPQIVISRPAQIKILNELPKTEKIDQEPVLAWSGNPGEIVVATLNTLNLFDDIDDPYTNDEGTPTKPREELEHLAATIRKLNADVLALQEVENRGYLERFNRVFLTDMGYNHVVHFDGNDLRGIDVALLSRAPLGEVVSRRHLEFKDPDGRDRKFQRDVPAITVLPKDAPPLEIWPVHLKSKSDSEETSEPIRLAEAAQIRKLLDARFAEDPAARIIITGDFNDVRESKAMGIILGTGTSAMWSPEARETEDSIPDPQFPDGRPPIDFITCSPAMKALYIEDSCQVRRAPDEFDGTDHDPLWARFRLQ